MTSKEEDAAASEAPVAAPTGSGAGSQTRESPPTGAARSAWEPIWASPTCPAVCCEFGEAWVQFHYEVDHYRSSGDAPTLGYVRFATLARFRSQRC
ncbi:hypothetical protein VTK56DRAFT_2981 [Thermocarpiscus australiensis]